MLYNCKRQFPGPEDSAFMKRHGDSSPELAREELERQLASLRRDIRQLQLVHDLLRKTHEII